MALATGANVALDNNWTLVATGISQMLLQLLGIEPVVVAIGAAQPSASSTDGHIVQPLAGRDTFSITGLTGEKVYARTLRTGASASVAVTKG